MAKIIRPHGNLSNCNGGHGCGGEDCTCPCHFEAVDGDDEEGDEAEGDVGEVEEINFVIARDDKEAYAMASYSPPIGGGFSTLPEAMQALRNIQTVESNLPRPDCERGAYAVYGVIHVVKRLAL